ncbi:transposable element Tcb1 transposase [Trichonephila inaurata madagascariensis]|uniref:Transposable element Tcb1 transposase n=1 Tax=Trichonephila inaurata madagascariensis TaxID=2747483 RepID=A0A8X6YGD2_9ARAC|nr:transposable element Tcb1 transposase [Trichonephila inaurata madagascariensis]
MALSEVGNLVFIDGILNHMVHLDILQLNLRESAKNFGSDGNLILQLDNDPKHKARQTVVSFSLSKQQLHTPPQFPDINVIENLWATLETAIQKHKIRNKTDLKQVFAAKYLQMPRKSWLNR